MEFLIQQLRNHPELAIFLTLALGFWIGKLKYRKFSLGIVTSVLLVGVLIGQLNIPIDGPAKSLFFLLFLFAIGYKVGPQFFRGLKKDGLPQVWFAIIQSVVCLLVTWVLAVIMGYNAGEAAGLLSGAQTISAVIGVSTDAIHNSGISAEQQEQMINLIPVAYAVTYIFGTAGSAWILSSVGPKMLGGLQKVKQSCKELESKMGNDEANQPGFIHAFRPVIFRAYRIHNEWFKDGRSVIELEDHFKSQGKRLFVERIRHEGQIIEEFTEAMVLHLEDEVVLSGRREYAIGEEDWIGPEVLDEQLLDFPVAVLPVTINHPNSGRLVGEVRAEKYMHGVSIRSIKRMGINIPIYYNTKLDAGDVIEVIGLKKEVEPAAARLGYVDRPSHAADMIYTGLGIFIGGILGTLAIHLGGVPISLSTSGGALIAGLIFGWWRTHRPDYGRIPESTLWFMNNVGLNIFIAIVGITAGPSFVNGFQQVGLPLFLIGAIATSIPLLVGVWMGRYIFKFHPSLTLGCAAGSRTTTAALGAIQEALGSETPALGYTITYAVGNTLLIIWGVIIVLLV